MAQMSEIGSRSSNVNRVGNDNFTESKRFADNRNADSPANLNGNFQRSSRSLQGDLQRVRLENTFAAQTAQSVATQPARVNYVEQFPAAQGLKFSETKSAESLAYTAQAGEVYQFPDGKEWEVVEVQDDPNSGFRAIALKPTDPTDSRVVVSYAGTEMTSLRDWVNNLSQAGGNTPEQYQQALAFAEKYQGEYGDNTILTGHSLGGGLASYSAIQTGLRATAINSAPLAPNNLGGNALFNPGVKDRPNITQYKVPGEALTDLDALDFFDARPGNEIEIPGRYWNLDPRAPIGNHLLSNTAIDIPDPVKVR